MGEIRTNAIQSAAVAAFEDWLERNREGSRLGAGTLATGLIVVEHMRDKLPLSADELAPGSQIRRQSGPNVQRILERYGEYRQFISEGGRTSRGNKARGIDLAESVSAVRGVSLLTVEERARIADQLQQRLVQLVGSDYFDQERLVPSESSQLTVAAKINDLLNQARARPGTATGAVAQHLVGAALALHYRGKPITVDDHGYTTGDVQTARSGDFVINQSPIHVTVAPSDALFARRCAANLRAGLTPAVVVPEASVAAASQLAFNSGVAERVSILALEQFVAATVELPCMFERGLTRHRLGMLYTEYNNRVARAESDPSLLLRHDDE